MKGRLVIARKLHNVPQPSYWFCQGDWTRLHLVLFTMPNPTWMPVIISCCQQHTHKL